MSIAEIIGWKFNNQPGMRCKEVDGVMTIIEFPNGIPSKEDQDVWATEYEAYLVIAELEASLKATDADMPRIVEDLIDTLITKGIIVESDLPQAAQDKLANRKDKRSKL